MINRNNKGVTLVSLVVTIIVLLIIASISIVGGIQGADTAADNKLLTELDMVQHAVLQRYTKYSLTKDKDLLVGTKVNSLPNPTEITWQVKNPQNDEEKYYELGSSELTNLGITNSKDTYIVNYSTGEVYNKTTPKTNSNEVLYIYSKASKSESTETNN